MTKEPTPSDNGEVKVGSRSTIYNEYVEKFAQTLLEVLGKYKSLREQRFAEFFATDEKDMSRIYIEYPPYQRAEAIYAHNRFLDEQMKAGKIKNSIRVETYDSGKETSPSYETIRISREKYENFLVEGYQYFVWDNIKLNQEIYFSGSSRYVRIGFRKADTEKVTEFITQLRLFMKNHALFKGEKLLFTRRGWVEVLEYPKLDWNNVILSPQIKREFELNLLTPLAEGADCIIKGIPWRRGLLLGGLAGTGKSQVCRVLCNQLKDVTVLWATPKAVQDEDDIAMLFDAARHYSPTLIIIEDIDFMGKSRDFSQDPSLGELLNQLDGNDPNFGIFVIATSVTGETPILIKYGNEIKLLPIKTFVESFNPKDEYYTLGISQGGYGAISNGNHVKEIKWVKLKDVYHHITNEIYEIRVKGENTIRTTGNHSVFIRTRSGVESRLVTELKIGDELVNLPYRRINGKIPISLEHNLTRRYSKELLRLYGLYLAEGHVHYNTNVYRYRLCFSFNSNEKQFIEETISTMKKKFGKKPISITHPEKTESCIWYCGKALCKHFLTLFGTGSKNKRLPNSFWTLSKEELLDLWSGYFDGDGCKTRNYERVTSASKLLLSDFCWMFRLLGMKAVLRDIKVKERKIGEQILKAGIYYTLNLYYGKYAKRSRIISIRKTIKSEEVYDLCGCVSEAFFGGFSPVLLHNTNRPEMLDSALANRPSRFDVLIEFKLPDKEVCKNLIKLFSRNMTFDKELDLENLALSMRDLTGAQIKESFVYARLVAIYNKKEIVAIEDVLKRAENYKSKNGAEAYRK